MATHWEVIYETGSHSVVQPENEEDAKEALKEQHRRASAGEQGGPTGHAAERVKRVLVYDDHPANILNTMHKDEALARAKEVVNELADENGVVDLSAVGREIEYRPRVESGPHESNYRMDETDELDLSFLDDKAGDK